MNEILKQQRIEEIINELAQLQQTAKYDVTLESTGDDGDVKIILTNGVITMEKTIGFKDDISFISETFSYPDIFTPSSRDFHAHSIKTAYFDNYGDLIVEHKDSTEMFKVKKAHREEVKAILRENLGKKFKS
jgi:hypothetical protein